MTSDATTAGPHDEALSRARALVLDAFARARQAGKANWTVMTTAVLKNRLLDLTDRDFSESQFGARDMVAFVRAMPDLLDLTPTEDGPAIVELRDPALVDGLPPLPTGSGEQAQGVRGRERLRPDLWRAAMDWGGERSYVLDGGRVRVKAEGDERLPVFEPVTEADFLAWKEAFVQRELETADPSSAELLQTWRSMAGPSRILGKKLQDRWMSHLRHQVAARVDSWFSQHGEASPDDLFVGPLTGPSGVRESGTFDEPAGEDRRLKEFVLRCVHAMTAAELRALSIPAAAASRVWHS
jgi:hypothetical protein